MVDGVRFGALSPGDIDHGRMFGVQKRQVYESAASASAVASASPHTGIDGKLHLMMSGLVPGGPREVGLVGWRQAGVAVTAGGVAAGIAAYLGLAPGAVPVDLGVGRRVRPLGPLIWRIAAPREAVYELIEAPYAERTTRALREKVRVLERGADMVLAAHYTPVRGRLKATTVETVRFRRPERVDFRLVRGPVPYVTESFTLEVDGEVTVLTYAGELGTDLWSLGQRWGDLVAVKWQATVKQSLDALKEEAERRHRIASPN